jgi:invasion protein IalB
MSTTSPVPAPSSCAIALIAALSIGGGSLAHAEPAAKAPTAPAQKSAPKAPAPAPATARAPEAKPQDLGNQNALPGRWTARCSSEGRTATLDCVVEQSAVMTQTGQLLLAITVRVPADTRRPVMMIHGPVGLFLPAGMSIQIDTAKPQQIALQTCDQRGCYAGMQVPAEMIAAMKSGKRFAVSFQNMAKENISVPFSLENFADAYRRIE